MARHRCPRRQDWNHGYAGVYRRCKRDETGAVQYYYGKFIPRFKPPREKLASGTTLKHDYLPLGGCGTPRAAKTLHDIAAFYYGKPHPVLDLGNGRFFSIPSMSEHENQTLHGLEKRAWVSCKAKEVFEAFEKEKVAMSIAFSSHDATSSVITGIEQLAATPSHDYLQDSALNQILEDLQFDLGDGFDSHALPWSGIPTWPGCEGDFIMLPTDDVELDENPVLSPQQASAVLGSEDIISSTMEVDLQQLVLFQKIDELQRELGEAQRQNRELQRREWESARSRQQQQRCLCQSHILHPALESVNSDVYS